LEAEGEVEVKDKAWGTPSQGQKTPTMTRRERRARRVVGPRMEEKGLLELAEDGAETGNALEKGFWRLLWCRKEDIAD